MDKSIVAYFFFGSPCVNSENVLVIEDGIQMRVIFGAVLLCYSVYVVECVVRSFIEYSTACLQSVSDNVILSALKPCLKFSLYFNI